MSKVTDGINIELDIEADKAINKLEKIKELLSDIEQLGSNVDYITETYYDDNQVYKEITIQYK